MRKITDSVNARATSPRIIKLVRNTIQEICVAEAFRGRGLGRKLVTALSNPLRLKCPVDNASNEFYRRLGFTLAEVVPGKKRDLNLWTLI